jgi:hypothetical protein
MPHETFIYRNTSLLNFSQLCKVNNMIWTKVDTLCFRPSWESDGIYSTEVHSISRGAHWLPVLLISEAGGNANLFTCRLFHWTGRKSREKRTCSCKVKKKKDNWITRRSLSLVSHIRTYSWSVCVHFVLTVALKSLFLQCLYILYLLWFYRAY